MIIKNGKLKKVTKTFTNPMSRIISRKVLDAYCTEHNLINDPASMQALIDGVKAMNKIRQWDWLRVYKPEPNEGFMFSSDPVVHEFMHHTSHDHTGATMAWTMGTLQFIAIWNAKNVKAEEDAADEAKRAKAEEDAKKDEAPAKPARKRKTTKS